MDPSQPVSVLLTHLNDPRGVRALQGLARSTLLPQEAILADGGSRADVLAAYRDLAPSLPFPLRIEHVPGSVADSREQAWDRTKGHIIAFLDADEVPPPSWLSTLTAPIVNGVADFTAGPTQGLDANDGWTRYQDELERWFYRSWVAKDIIYAPMGNTAWSRGVFRRLKERDGHVFDRRLGRGGEDFDVNIRAVAAGFHGRYVPEAILLHDHSRLHGLRKVLKKKYDYAYAEFRLRRRHAAFLRARPVPAPEGAKPRHVTEVVEPFVRRWARFRSRAEP